MQQLTATEFSPVEKTQKNFCLLGRDQAMNAQMQGLNLESHYQNKNKKVFLS